MIEIDSQYSRNGSVNPILEAFDLDNKIFDVNVYDVHLSSEEEHDGNGEDDDERDNDVGDYIIRGLELES